VHRYILPLCLAGLALSPSRAAALTDPLWGEVRLVAGVTAARRVLSLGGSEGRSDADWLVDVVHRFEGAGDWSDSVGRLERYLEAMQAIRQAATQWPSGVRVPAPAAPNTERDAVKRFLELLGLSIHEDHGRLTAIVDDSTSATERAAWLAAGGVNVAAVAERLNAGEAVAVSIGESVLPLPLPAFWETSVYQRGHINVVDILRDRSTAFLYAGLLALDDETLRFLADRPKVVRRLHDEAAAAFAAFGRSLRIRGGVIDLPGGSTTEALWRALVDHPSTQPEAFVADLFGRDNGRLAYFYDAIDRLDAPHQAFALGGPALGKARVSLVRHVYEWFTLVDAAGWKINNRPFNRPTLDAALVLGGTDLNAPSFAGPSGLPALLDRIVSSPDWPSNPERTVRDLKDGQTDAWSTLAWVFDRPTEAVSRFQLLRFAQRAIAPTDRSAIPSVEAALRAFRDMPALALTLERMGVRDPVVFARVARGAHALTEAGGRDEVEPILARWQSALALLEQIQRRRHLPASVLLPLVASLGDTASLPRDRVGEATVRWVTDQLLPLFVPDDTPAAQAESVAVTAVGAEPIGSRVHLTWEGLPYVVNTQGPWVRDVLAVRAASPTPSVGDLLAFEASRRRLERGLKNTDELAAFLVDLEPLRAVIRAVPAEVAPQDTMLGDFNDIVKSLQDLSKGKDLSKALRQLPALTQLVGTVNDAVIPPLVYAFAVAPTGQPAAVYAGAWRDHALGPSPQDAPSSWRQVAWRIPESEPRTGGGLLLRGSWFAIDVALAASRMPRVTEEGIGAEGPFLPDRAVLIGTLSLRADHPSEDAATLERVMTNLQRGRDQAAAWRTTPPSRDELRAALHRAAVDRWRANVVLWLVDRRSELAAAELTLTELARLGGEPDLPAGWGASSQPFDGCWCMTSPGARPSDDFRGYFKAGVPGALATDLPLRLAEHLARLHLPLSLVVDLLPAATADWLWHVTPYGPDDWQALSAWPKLVDATRVEKYLLRLVADGKLVPPDGGLHP
jgi:hypothetical protein